MVRTSNNYESIGSPAKSNSARIPGRMNNQIGTSVHHIPRIEWRNVNQQRVPFTNPFPTLFNRPPVDRSAPFFSKSARVRTSVSRYESDPKRATRREGVDGRSLGSNSILTNLWRLVHFVVVIVSILNRRIL